MPAFRIYGQVETKPFYSIPILAKRTTKGTNKAQRRAQSIFKKFSVSSVLTPCSLWFYSKIDFENIIWRLI